MDNSIKEHIDFPAIVENAGVDLKPSGSRYIGLCPFHADTSPSFFVFPDGHFKCFSCGEYGDAVDFIRKFHRCGFKEALAILGIRQEKLTPERREEIKQLKRKRGLLKAFRRWEREAVDHATLLCWRCRTLLGKIRDPETLEQYGDLYHLLQLSEYHFSILTDGTNEDRFELFRSRQI